MDGKVFSNDKYDEKPFQIQEYNSNIAGDAMGIKSKCVAANWIQISHELGTHSIDFLRKSVLELASKSGT